MQINAGSFFSGTVRINPFQLDGHSKHSTATPTQPDSQETVADLSDIRQHLLAMQELLEPFSRVETEHTIKVNSSRMDPARTASAMPLGLASPSDAETAIQQLTALSSIQSGQVLVNNQPVSIDVQSDSLLDILHRIEDTTTVRGTYLRQQDKVSLTAQGTTSLVLDENSTNLLSSLRITPGTYEPIPTRRGSLTQTVEGMSKEDATEFVKSFIELAESFNDLYDTSKFRKQPGSFIQELQDVLQTTFQRAFDKSGPRFETDWGLRINLDTPTRNVIHTSGTASRAMVRALMSDPARVNETLFGTEDDAFDGLLERIKLVMETADASLEEIIKQTTDAANQEGTVVDQQV